MKQEQQGLTRRTVLKMVTATTATLVGSSLFNRISAAEAALEEGLKGKINHSVCRWCYGSIPLEDLCIASKEMGITSIELVGPEEWPMLKKYGLTSALPQGAGMGIEKGFNDLKYHDELVESYVTMIPKVAEAGYNQIICFSGNRNGLDDEQGIKNCAVGLKRIMKVVFVHLNYLIVFLKKKIFD